MLSRIIVYNIHCVISDNLTLTQNHSSTWHTVSRELFCNIPSHLPKKRVSNFAPPISLSDELVIPFQLLQVIRASASPTLWLPSLNGRTFFNLADIIEHIYDYLVELERVKLYCDSVEQTTAIFEIGSLFASNLIKVVKKIRAGGMRNRLP